MREKKEGMKEEKSGFYSALEAPQGNKNHFTPHASNLSSLLLEDGLEFINRQGLLQVIRLYKI